MTETDSKTENPSASSGLRPRPPIVVVVGHVDHGKTSLLDYLRKTSYLARAASSSTGEPRPVAGREAGGITQSIGAYEIIHHSDGSRMDADNQRISADENIRKNLRVDPRESAGDFSGSGRKVTFIDTPGHEAFSKMRSRGCRIADLAILVVAADEGVKPQTQESIKILEETKTPFIVAITKIDKSGANIEKVKNELSSTGVLLEGYGGQVSWHGISSKTGEGVNDLLDLILLAADLENFTFDPSMPASGFVLEAKVDPRRGLEATLIVKNGILRRGDTIATPTAIGKIKILENFLGETVESLEPSAPALVIGLDTLPEVGEEFVGGEEAVRGIREVMPTAPKPTAPAAAENGEKKVLLNLVLKAGDKGSLEVISEIVTALAIERPIKVVAESLGDVTDNDIKLAISTGAFLIAFRNKIDKAAKTLGETNNVRIIASDIIYTLVKAIEDYLKEQEAPKSLGELEVLAIFRQEKPENQVIGGKVTHGVFKNKALVEIQREGASVGTGRILNLQEEKKDTHQVVEGKEAGLLISSQELVKARDKLIIKE